MLAHEIGVDRPRQQTLVTITNGSAYHAGTSQRRRVLRSAQSRQRTDQPVASTTPYTSTATSAFHAISQYPPSK